ncbi:hypothetical protein DAEQUDRAFT_770061 [Daedalea quercina L-15889]|uniref:Uncharacterized protein n=1 Tax=Daedalea quercina L-15889 TaxID=1314783 RepID=A0A165L7T4_9APHY|nr:hypothetical protein DAEQUDRAFT_770061 [Daedalea quercina L-15889]
MGQSASKTSQVKRKSNGPCGHCGGKHGEENCWKKYPHLMPNNLKKKKGGNKGKGKKSGGSSGSGNGQSSNTVSTSSIGTSSTSTSTAGVLQIDPQSAASGSVQFSTSFYVADHSAGANTHSTDWIMDSETSRI